MLSMNIFTGEYGTPILAVMCGGDTLEYDIDQITKRNQKFDGVYDKINEYFKTLSQKDAEAFFRILRNIEKAPKTEMDTTDYMLFLKNETRKAVRALNLERFTDWYRSNYGDLNIPDTMQEVFDYNRDKGESEAKTYTISDFVDFIALALFLRMFLPLYAEYLAYISGVDKHPYYRIFRLFLDSDVDLKSPALEKLRAYVQVTHESRHGTGGRENLVIGAGLTDDDTVDYLIAEALFNKLSLVNYYGTERKINPISHIHQLVNYSGKFRSAETDNIRLKNIKNINSAGSEDDYAVFEGNYRKTTKTAPGLITEKISAMKNTRIILSGLGYDPDTFDWDFYRKECKENMATFMKYPIDDTTIYLLGWFLNKSIRPQSLFYCENKRRIELILLAKTCLYMSGQEYMGAFLSSIYDQEASLVNPNVIIKGSLSKELLDELKQIFSYSIEDKGLVYEKVVIEVSRRIVNLPWKPIGEVNPAFVSEEGYLLAPANITEVIVDYIRFVSQLDGIN